MRPRQRKCLSNPTEAFKNERPRGRAGMAEFVNRWLANWGSPQALGRFVNQWLTNRRFSNHRLNLIR